MAVLLIDGWFDLHKSEKLKNQIPSRSNYENESISDENKKIDKDVQSPCFSYSLEKFFSMIMPHEYEIDAKDFNDDNYELIESKVVKKKHSDIYRYSFYNSYVMTEFRSEFRNEIVNE